MKMRPFSTTVVGRRLVTDSIVEVSVARPPTFAFTAGQYMQVGLDQVTDRDFRGNSRVFSISSSPNDTETLTFAFRRSGSSFKQTMSHIEPGATVHLAGPYGHVTLTHLSRRPRVMFASGVGITPHVSMLRFATEEALSLPITVLYVVSARDRGAYLPEIEACARAHPTIDITVTTRMPSDNELNRARTRYANALWYLSGSPRHVTDATVALHRVGVRDDDLITEEFLGY